MLRPVKCKMELIARDCLIQESPVTTERIAHANHIYGPDVLGLKGKGTKRKIPSISADIIKFTPLITSLYQNVTACDDILFFNKFALFSAISLNIQYGYVEHFLNRQIPTFLKSINHVRSHYSFCVFLFRVIKFVPEFKPLLPGLDRVHFILNNTGHGDHVLESERFVCTTKKDCHAEFTRTPFKKLPIVLTINLVPVTIFCDNSVVDEYGVPQSISLKGIITGCSLNFHSHFQIKLGSYVQTAKEVNNTIAPERTIGAIAIGPTEKSQGTQTFMNLNTGQYISRKHWTPLSMPQNVIDCIHQLANTQPCSLEFLNYNNQLMISKDYDMYDDTDNESNNSAEVYDSTDVMDIHDDKYNATVEEDANPYPGVPAII